MIRPPAPRAAALYFDEDGDASITADEVWTPADQPDAVETGLLDASGAPIMRARKRIKFGFCP